MPSKPRTSGRVRPSAGGARLRRQLVEQLEGSGALKSAAVRRAFLTVPRERFLPEVAQREGLERVYLDQAIVTAHDDRGFPTSSSSQPSLMASMLEELDLHPGQRVLEVGAGTGYNAALLSRIVGARGRVVSVELDPATARGARRGLADVKSPAKVVQGDGRRGWQRGAPYDRIIVTASADTVSRAWYDELADGGLLELPLAIRQAGPYQAILTFRKQDQGLRSQALLHGGFMPLRDTPGGPVPPPPPNLSATELIGRQPRSLAHLSGQALRRLSATARQRLLSLALSEPRARELGLRASRPALALYLTLEAPTDRLIVGWRHVGVMDANGGGLALLAGGGKTFTRIESYGDRDAERLLLELIDGWKQRGRPTGDHLRVEVTLRGRTGTRVSFGWDAVGSPAP